MEIPFGKPIVGEPEFRCVKEVLESGHYVHGPKSKQFEKDFAQFTKAPHAVSTSSCTSALHLAYFGKGIKTGDEVLCPAQTHAATAHAIELVGATPVFVDAELATGNIDLDQIEQCITVRTKAISIVHYLGMPVNMEKLMALAKKHDLYVIEDCALAVGSYFKGIHAGLWGDLGCFSFYPVKHFTTTEGGMLITKHEDVARRIERQRAFGVDRTPTERSIPGIYDVTMLGFNYRMSEVEAALGIEQLKRVPTFLEKRQQNFTYLYEKLTGLEELTLFETTRGAYQSSYYCLSVMLNQKLAANRFEIVKYLNNEGVGTSIYYPEPVPYFTYYRQKYGYKGTEYPNAARISHHSIALPVGPHLNLEHMEKIYLKLKAALQQIKPERVKAGN